MTRSPALIRSIACCAIRAELAVELGERLPADSALLGAPRTAPWRRLWPVQPLRLVPSPALQPAE